MDKEKFVKQFANRLREAMISVGYNSSRSPYGVNLQKLAEITGYSLQICRKYLRGQALPEPQKIVEIAQKLDTTAGWLLFGEIAQDGQREKNYITIHKI